MRWSRSKALFCFLLVDGWTRGGLAESTSTAGPVEASTTAGKSIFGKIEEMAESVVEFAEGGSSLSEEFPAETSKPGQPTTISDTTVTTKTTITTTTTTTVTASASTTATVGTTTTVFQTPSTTTSSTSTRRPRVRPSLNCAIDVCLSSGYQIDPR